MRAQNLRMKAAVVAAMMLCGSATNAYASAGCTALLGTGASGAVTSGSNVGTGFSAGDTIAFTVTAGTSNFVDGNTGTTLVASTSSNWTYVVPAATTDQLRVQFTSSGSWTCTAGSGGGGPGSGSSSSSPQTISQTINNAQAAVANGQQTLQNLNNWVANGVMGSFGLIGSTSGGNPNRPQAARPAARLQALGAAGRLDKLTREERSLLEEQAERPQDADVTSRLAEVRRELRYARVSASIAAGPAGDGSPLSLAPTQDRAAALDERQASVRQMMVTDGRQATDGSRPQQSAPTSVNFGSKDLIAMCEPGDGEVAQYNAARDMLGAKWNVWGEGRFVGAWDSLAQTNSRGLIGSGGVDYKFTPWLALGVSIGVETFETKFGSQGVRLGSLGVTVMPYAGFRLSDNLFASVFVGLTPIGYNSNPQPTSGASFNALRLLVGGALFGNWQFGDWRVRPTLSGTYGSETQYGYTDSQGTVVGGQVVSYGRLSAGPEIGYTIWSADKSWSVEPYVLARANLDFASSNSTVLQGQSVVLRPGTLGSGSAGLGVDARFSNGFYFRVQGSYDSIGVTGLDVISGMIRGGLTF
jgi:hypothetical protein